MSESGKPVPNEIIHASDIYSKQEVVDLINIRKSLYDSKEELNNSEFLFQKSVTLSIAILILF